MKIPFFHKSWRSDEPLPAASSDLSPGGSDFVAPEEPVFQFELGDAKNFVYLVVDWKTRSAALVDSRPEWTPIVEFLDAHSLRLEKLLLTHAHADHTLGIPQALRRSPNIAIHVHPRELDRLSRAVAVPPENLRLTQDGEAIELGATRIEAFHTPGHSPGALCYWIAPNAGRAPLLFTGDTLFIEDCGRTDLPGGSDEEMFRSLQRLKTFDPTSLVLPGHHYRKPTFSTLASELARNPALRVASIQELVALA
jgi:glyoxylase-like metal-dependent hydrolase (beta-lactamase superfamily II)